MSITVGKTQDDRGLYEHWIECNGCDSIITFIIGHVPERDVLREIAKGLGWIVGKLDYCVDCQELAQSIADAKKSSEL